MDLGTVPCKLSESNITFKAPYLCKVISNALQKIESKYNSWDDISKTLESNRPDEEDDVYEDNDIFDEEDEDTDEWTPQSNKIGTPKRKIQIAKKKTSARAEVSKVVTSLFED